MTDVQQGGNNYILQLISTLSVNKRLQFKLKYFAVVKIIFWSLF